jgi:hypothetical protein
VIPGNVSLYGIVETLEIQSFASIHFVDCLLKPLRMKRKEPPTLILTFSRREKGRLLPPPLGED